MKVYDRERLNEKGLTLVEIIASLLILSLISIGVITLFSTSGKIVKKSADVLDATYYAQSNIEELIQLSKDAPYDSRVLSLTDAGWTDVNGGVEFEKEATPYIVRLELTQDGNLVNVLIKVSKSSSPAVIESQMESIVQWRN